MADVNEELKRIREAEEDVTKKIKEENEKALVKIEEAKKNAEEILKKTEKDLESIRISLEKNYNEQIENEISKLKAEWEEKLKKLNSIKIDKNYIDEIAKSMLEEK